MRVSPRARIVIGAFCLALSGVVVMAAYRSSGDGAAPRARSSAGPIRAGEGAYVSRVGSLRFEYPPGMTIQELPVRDATTMEQTRLSAAAPVQLTILVFIEPTSAASAGCLEASPSDGSRATCTRRDMNGDTWWRWEVRDPMRVELRAVSGDRAYRIVGFGAAGDERWVSTFDEIVASARIG